MTRRIYLASSWRNPQQPDLVLALRAAGHEVYDFRNPPAGAGFGWEELGELDTRNAHGSGWVDRDQYLGMIRHPIAEAGFDADFSAMTWADTFVLALPCGRSAHLEAGWAVGAGKPTAIYLGENPMEPELMYRMVDHLATDLDSLLAWLEENTDG